VIARTSRRLAGFRFETSPPPTDDTLPRMDVAVFVGFAASGPLHTPVAVESAVRFADVFGADAPLAWDPVRGEPAYAHLAPAVRAFFRNGGRRCWIVRVAGAAVSNTFAVPCLAWLNADGTITPAFVQARSEGSWSDGLRIATTLEEDIVQHESVEAAKRTVGLDIAEASGMAVGDLLRLTFESHGCVQLFAVQSFQPPKPTSPVTNAVVEALGGPSVWLQTPGQKRPTKDVGTAVWFGPEGRCSPVPAFIASGWPNLAGDQTVSIDVAATLAEAALPGSLVRVALDGSIFWLAVRDAWEEQGAGSPVEKRVRLTGQGFWQLSDPPSDLPAEPTSVERLTFDLWVRHGEEYPVRLSGLGFAAGQPNFWRTLPTDAELYGDQPDTPLAHEVTSPRFPLAGACDPGSFSFPLGMALFPATFVGPNPLTPTALKRDGLEYFDARLFLGGDDPVALRALLGAGTGRILEVADFLRYQAATTRTLQGIYAALAVDEASLIVVPDIVQRGWERGKSRDPAPPQDEPAADTGPPKLFVCCDTEAIAIPVLFIDLPGLSQRFFYEAADGTFSLSWAPIPDAVFELQEATQYDFSDAAPVYTGKGDRFDIYGHRQGNGYYRLRAVVAGVSTGWSAGLVVRVAPPSDWQMISVDRYEKETRDKLLVVQRAMLRMCAGRGDLLAVLALPAHYREDDAITHVSELVSPSGRVLSVSLPASPLEKPPACAALSDGESATASYGAIYHPWLIGREEGQPDALRLAPPDGAACGILAKRAIARGAWVAPANEALAGPVGLSPAIAPDRWLDLLDAQVNLVRDEPRGFLALSADTLSGDDALRPINVRRLLILLRRLALRLGADYVFEPNDESFRRAVQRSFESIMEFMFARGAFAGRTPAASFQVITGSAVNTLRDQDEGRFFVELRVAPSLPLTFLTVRLVQNSERGTVTEVR
jgi:hypothetical protein